MRQKAVVGGMDRRLQTSLGELRLSGAASPFEGDRPLLLVLRGAFADPGQYASLETLLPEFRVVFGEMPGFRAPPLRDPAVETLCQAWSEALAVFHGPVAVCGASLGGVVALGLHDQGQQSVLAIDPPFRSADAAPLRARLRPADGFERDFAHAVFGWAADGDDAPRDHLHLLTRLRCPAVVLAGSDGGPDRVPGLISDETLAEISAHPLISAKRIAGVGHDVARGASPRVLQVLRNMAAHGTGRSRRPSAS